MQSHASKLISLAIHAGVVALLFTATTHPTGRKLLGAGLDRATRLIAPYLGPQHGGGGGGGDHSLLRASRGALPRAARRQFVPPAAAISNPEPKLILEPTIVVPESTALPVLNMAQLGDPKALAGPLSNGRGKGGGIGDGDGGGVGPGDGLGYGPGHKYGAGGGDPLSGGAGRHGVTTPAALVWKIEPEYSDEARRAKLQGTIVLLLEVDAEGKPRNIRVRQGLGLGLEEKAIEAVMHWKFRPGRRDGRPVMTPALVEVNFRLL